MSTWRLVRQRTTLRQLSGLAFLSSPLFLDTDSEQLVLHRKREPINSVHESRREFSDRIPPPSQLEGRWIHDGIAFGVPVPQMHRHLPEPLVVCLALERLGGAQPPQWYRAEVDDRAGCCLARAAICWHEDTTITVDDTDVRHLLDDRLASSRLMQAQCWCSLHLGQRFHTPPGSALEERHAIHGQSSLP